MDLRLINNHESIDNPISFSVSISVALRMKVCVIGAGVAGLVAIKRISEVPGFQAVAYEQSGDIGGVWSDFDNQERCYITPMYHNLRCALTLK